jgi:UPF0755 protein
MRRAFIAVVVALAVAGLGAASVARWLDRQARQPYRAYAGSEQLVDIPPGSSVAVIGRQLADAGVVRDVRLFRWAVWRSGAARRLQAGEYRFNRPLATLEVVDRLLRGDVALWPITFPEGLTVDEMGAIFEDAGLGPAAGFVDAARAVRLVVDLDPAADDLEGYLFPDTYALPRGTSPSRLISLMVARFRDTFGPALRADASRLGLSVRQTVTLASLIEEETGRAEERSLVSAAYHNRLRIGMRLQCDPTIIFALRRAGRYTGNLRKADLELDSPYNTYRYTGLPPGPIAAPGRASLDAAVRPAPVDVLYFVSRNDGTHAFASTLAEHNANVRTYQVERFREQRRRARVERQ